MEIHEELARTVEAGDALLFAGAGCSALVGIPVWGEYLEFLAETAQRFEPETAALMRKRIATGSYLAAATLFKRILQAPPGEIHEALSPESGVLWPSKCGRKGRPMRFRAQFWYHKPYLTFG